MGATGSYALERLATPECAGDVKCQPIEPINKVEYGRAMGLVSRLLEPLDHESNEAFQKGRVFRDGMFGEGASKGSSIPQVSGFVCAQYTHRMTFLFITSPGRVLANVTVTVDIFPSLRSMNDNLFGAIRTTLPY